MKNFSLFSRPPSRSVHIYRNAHVGGRHYPYWHCFLTRGLLLSASRAYIGPRPVSFEKTRARVKSRLISRIAHEANLSRSHNGWSSLSGSHKEARFSREFIAKKRAVESTLTIN